jgi:hypothetical protein
VAAPSPAAATQVTQAASPAVAPEPAPPAGKSDYALDLSSAARPAEFSAGNVRFTKSGHRPYLGPFAPPGVTFTVGNLKPHQFVRVKFDLALMNSWNGCSTTWGPDVWSCSLVNGPTLLTTTFSNCGFFSDNNEQDFPDVYPALPGMTPHPAWTGASENQSLGEMRSWGGPNRTFDASGVYHIDWTFPHADSTLSLNFMSKPKKRDKTFGFLSFHVATLAGPTKLSDLDLKQAWIDLDSENAAIADGAVWKLIAAGDQAVNYLEGQKLVASDTSGDAKRAYRLSRVRHVLEVIASPAASELKAMLPAQ